MEPGTNRAMPASPDAAPLVGARPTARRGEVGLSLLELVVALALFALVGGLGIAAVSDGLILAANEAAASSARQALAMADAKIKRELRSASVATDGGVVLSWVHVTATAGMYNRIAWRPVLGYDSATESTLYGPERRIFWEPEPGDPLNGNDDDRDGLVDEGRVVLEATGGGAFRSILAMGVDKGFHFDAFPNGDTMPLNFGGAQDYALTGEIEVAYRDRLQDVRRIATRFTISFRNGRRS